MARLLWLPDVLRAVGLKVLDMDGWATRGSDRFDPEGIVCHHTATPASASDAVVAKILRDGRADLKGPLSQLGLQRNGVWVVVASGRANHNGFGEWGNDSIGVEAYNDGVGEAWPTIQMDAYARGCAAIARQLGMNETKVKGHKETDPKRKIDPTFNMPTFRNAVAQLLKAPSGDDDMTAEQAQQLADVFQRVQAMHADNWVDVHGRGDLSWLEDKVRQVVREELAAKPEG